MKNFFQIAVLGLLLGALLACQPPDGNGKGGGTISGRVYDWVTGAGISGATVIYGDYSATTDLSGAYSLTVPEGVSSVDGVLAAFKGLEYSFLATGAISGDPTPDPVYNIGLAPIDTSSYPETNLAGRIFDDTPAEISEGCGIRFAFVNEQGGLWESETNYAAASGYAVATKAFGSSCFVIVNVLDESDDPLFQYYLTGQDLSSDRTDYDFTKPSTGFTDVTLNGTLGTNYQGSLIGPNSLGVEYAGGDLFGFSQATLQLYNPNNYPMVWVTSAVDADNPLPGLNTLKMHAQTMPFSGTIALPAAYTHAAPLGAVVGTTVSWDAGTRTLSFGAVSGANGYLLMLDDDQGSFSSMMVLSTPSISFPAELVANILDAGTGWDVTVWPLYSPQANSEGLVELATSIDPTGNSPPLTDLQAALIQSSAATKVDAIP
jgi:hypothetical protein